MKIEFDPAKNTRNTKERGLPFVRVAELGWDQALIYENTRRITRSGVLSLMG